VDKEDPVRSERHGWQANELGIGHEDLRTLKGRPEVGKQGSGSLPQIFVIILNWNGLEDTIECLESLRAINYPNYQVIVVDNGSEGDDAEALENRYGDYLQIITNDHNAGFAEGNNIAIRLAMDQGADYMLLLNNDTLVDSEFVSEMVSVAEQVPEAGLLTGKVYYDAVPDVLQTVGGKVNWWTGHIKGIGQGRDQGQYDSIRDLDFVVGTAMLIRRSVVERVGYLDASFFFGSEDIDYSTRAKRAGFKVLFVPAAKVWHKAGASRKKLADYPEDRRLIQADAGPGLYRHAFKLFRKHSPRGMYPWAFLGHVVITIAARYGGGLLYCIRQRDLYLIKNYIRVLNARKHDATRPPDLKRFMHDN